MISYWFYKYFIDPLLGGIRQEIKKIIPEQAKVLDIACGTGSLIFELAPFAEKATGIDLAEDKIRLANRMAQQKNIENISFQITDATKLPFKAKSFDYVVLSMAVHQFNPELVDKIISESLRLAPKVIFADYKIPLPNSWAGKLCKVIEFLAGGDHYRNFRCFEKAGGLESTIIDNNLQMLSDKTISGVFSITVCQTENA